MTSPSLIDHPLPQTATTRQTAVERLATPAILFVITLFSTTAVGMRYMYNFRLGRPPLSSDADVLPYTWVFHHLSALATGLPFSLTLMAILLAHEFGHYFACRHFKVRSTLPYMLPAPSLSGTFGAVIRLKSRVPSRSALLVIGAAGPLAGFAVAIGGAALGLLLSSYATTVVHPVQAPLLLEALHALEFPRADTVHALSLIVPHPVLSACWIGLLITTLNLIPAGQLDGGHILYALSPSAHRITSRVVTAILLLLGVFFWAPWILWGLILLTPGMRHPKVPQARGLERRQLLLIPLCLAVLLLAATYRPFQGYGLLEMLHKLPHRYF